MIHYLNPENQQVYGYNPDTQQSLIDQAVAKGWTYVAEWPPAATNEQLLAQCKQIASGLLKKTDWAAASDVGDSANSPYLLNKAEFIAYRSTVRGYVVNPVVDPTWPAVPTAQWSS